MSKLISKLSKRSSASKRYEGAVECSDFECVSFRDKPYQLENRTSILDSSNPPEGQISEQSAFERGEGRQSFNEGIDSKYSGRLNQTSITTVNNLSSTDRKLAQSHVFSSQSQQFPSNAIDQPTAANQETDQLGNLQRKRPGSARYARAVGTVNGAKHGSSSSLSSNSSMSSTGSFSNNVSNGFGHPEHAELFQSINQSLNQLSLVEDVQTGPLLNAPPKPKRPSTDRVKTTMAFYANKPSFVQGENQPSVRQV